MFLAAISSEKRPSSVRTEFVRLARSRICSYRGQALLIEGLDRGAHRSVHRKKAIAIGPEAAARWLRERFTLRGAVLSTREHGSSLLQFKKDILEMARAGRDQLSNDRHGLSHAHLIHPKIE